MTASAILVAVSGALLVLTYGGFAGVLGAIVRLRRPSQRGYGPTVDASPEASAPAITVYFSALNEEDNVTRRLDNIFETEYDASKIRVIVVSDGSTDRTADRARAYIQSHPGRSINLVELAETKGPAFAQNLVPSISETEIVVATDADAIFRRDTLVRLVSPFQDARVAVVGAVVIYQDPSNSSLGYGYGKYRGIERKLRSWESQLGILVKVDGPCVAYRLSIWQELKPFEALDQVICLWAQLRQLHAVQADDAVCYDWANQTSAQELRQRARMTRKALLSTFHRWGLRETLTHPLFSIALWLHKLVRFFSPALLIMFLTSALVQWGLNFLWLLIVLALGLAPIRQARKALYAFGLAQVSFALGLWSWAMGDKTGAYAPTRTLKGSQSRRT
ncbi:hypothetical protein CKO31_17280 [Thiohalocapsa halophila]|uniref:Glycosyltransferase 2-like domain-containing protein n=1 Tax=Thiohalocapsa halophila TaxID=69359 RepID=A0ABS1CKJ8_9GAMM|nr:glycosyltransferase [Thiohalocapsa halophila]MBK1632461.1 hypothetical protein [Thiohalocapsa halophila]